MSALPKILHFSPVKKSPEIVALHCQSLRDLDCESFELTYSFFDDNDNAKSSDILNKFALDLPDTIIFSEKDLPLPPKVVTHKRWNKDDYERIIEIKDYVISFFLQSDFDFLFLTDADLVLHPKTLQLLHASKKDFVAEVFWTHFSGRPTYFPNAWYDEKSGYSNSDQLKAFRDQPLLEVDYTGACTLLSRKILASGVRFKRIKNLSRTFLGEDKHFCIRAHVNDFTIFLHTETPAFHIYDEGLITQAQDYVNSGYKLDYLSKDWLNASWEQLLNTYFSELEMSYKDKIKNKLKNIISGS